MIAHLQVLHLGADRSNDASAFVTQNDRKWDGVVLIPDDHVRVAHAGRHDSDKDFIGYRGAQADGLDVEGGPFGSDNGRLDLHFFQWGHLCYSGKNYC